MALKWWNDDNDDGEEKPEKDWISGFNVPGDTKSCAAIILNWCLFPRLIFFKRYYEARSLSQYCLNEPNPHTSANALSDTLLNPLILDDKNIIQH